MQDSLNMEVKKHINIHYDELKGRLGVAGLSMGVAGLSMGVAGLSGCS